MRCTVRNVSIVFMIVACASCAGDDDVARRQLKQLQKQATKLVDAYRDATPHSPTRHDIVQAAAEQGVLFAAPIWNLVRAERQQAFALYQQMLYASLASAPQVDAPSALAANESLQLRRAYAKRLSMESLQLRSVVNPRHDEQLELLGRDVNQPDVTSESQLQGIERRTVEVWLTAHGYQRLNGVEKTLLIEVNRRRAKKKLAPLQVDYQLCAAAREHSTDMVRKRFFSHTSKLPGKTTFVDRAARFHASAMAENIGNGPDPWTIMSLWMASTGHKRAILEPSYTRIGVGQVGRKYTMLLGAGERDEQQDE